MSCLAPLAHAAEDDLRLGNGTGHGLRLEARRFVLDAGDVVDGAAARAHEMVVPRVGDFVEGASRSRVGHPEETVSREVVKDLVDRPSLERRAAIA